MDDVRLLDYETILHQLADVLARVGHRDLIDLVRVKPDLALAALEHASGEALLETQ